MCILSGEVFAKGDDVCSASGLFQQLQADTDLTFSLSPAKKIQPVKGNIMVLFSEPFRLAWVLFCHNFLIFITTSLKIQIVLHLRMSDVKTLFPQFFV